MDFPGTTPTPLAIHTWTRYVHTYLTMSSNNVLGAITPPTANRAVYLSLALPFDYVVRRVFWWNGTTAAGTTDLGIYAFTGERIYSTGATAAVGTSSQQYVTPADPIVLRPGRYWLGISQSGTTSRLWGGSPSNSRARLMGVTEEASAHPLPAVMTPTVLSTLTATLPLIGITRTPSNTVYA